MVVRTPFTIPVEFNPEIASCLCVDNPAIALKQDGIPPISSLSISRQDGLFGGAAVSDSERRTKRQTHSLSQKPRRKPVFHLYVSGATPRSSQAIANLRPVLEGLYEGDYELLVTDIYQQPHEATAARVHMAPTLVREYPAPILRVVGDFSNMKNIRAMLAPGASSEIPDV
jgi:circadian clock protein KaiB